MIPASMRAPLVGLLAAATLVLSGCGGSPTADDNGDGGKGSPKGTTAAEKVYAWNTFEILAFRTGNPDNPVNAIPGRATADTAVAPMLPAKIWNSAMKPLKAGMPSEANAATANRPA